MITAKIDEDRFLDLVRSAPVIAFQRLEFGWAIAAPSEAYYAPIAHPGGGNFGKAFVVSLQMEALRRLGNPDLRTLRPTKKPVPTQALTAYLSSAFGPIESRASYAKADGSHPAVIDFECQEVIRAIEEDERPDLKQATEPALRDALSDALDLVVHHATEALELAEVGDWEPRKLQLHIQQASTAMTTALTYLLRP